MVVIFVVLLTPGNGSTTTGRASAGVDEEEGVVSLRELLGAYLSVILPER
jgi:hypothetical protein